MKKKGIPVLFNDESECCGCSACYAVCPQRAISMKSDRYGFLYPAIDESLCVRCMKCVKVCAFKKQLSDLRR